MDYFSATDFQNVIEHNGFGVDFSVLDKTLLHYSLLIAEDNKFCPYKIYRSNSANLRQEFNIQLNHHDALSDAKAYTELWLSKLRN